MKVRFFVLLFLLALIFQGCKNSSNAKEETVDNEQVIQPTPMEEVLDTQQLAEMKFDQMTYNFPDIEEGKVVKKYFSFLNSGPESLVIKDVRTSCGCTTAEVPQRPVPPGERDSLLVEFDTKGRLGYNSKAITVVANTSPATQHLFLKGNVIK